jgi:hypothetical protein
MKRILTLLLALLVFTPLAHADDAARAAKAEKLMEVMHVDRMLSSVFDSLKTQMPAMLGAVGSTENMTAQQKAVFEEFQGKLIDLLNEEMHTGVMPHMAEIYARTFTDEELDAMITFYSSPVGQSVLLKLPQITQNSATVMQGLIGDMMPKMKALSEEYAPRFKAAGLNRQP